MLKPKWTVSLMAAALTLTACAAQDSVAQADTVITGRIVGEDGNPTRKGMAQVFEGPVLVAGAETDANGEFRLEVKTGGLLALKVCGVGHLCDSAALPLDGSMEVDVLARLRRLPYDEIDWSKAELAILGGAQVPFVRQSDGTYTAEIASKAASPSVAIISGAEAAGNFAPPDASTFREQPNAKSFWAWYAHAAVMTPIEGKVRVSVDPAQLESGKLPALFRLRGLPEDLARLQEPWQQMASLYLPMEKMQTAEAQAAARKTLARMRSTLEKELAWVNLATTFTDKERTPENARQVLEAVRAESPAWRAAAFQLALLTPIAGRGGADEAYFEKAVSALPPSQQTNVRTMVFYDRFYAMLTEGRYPEARDLAQAFSRDYPQAGTEKYALNKLGGPGLLAVPGKQIPEWKAHDFKDPDKIYTHPVITAKARIYLLNFWASW